MDPEIITHNSVSLDGSVKGFYVDMQLHYETGSKFGADSHLIGSETAVKGVKEYAGKMDSENEADFEKPLRPEKPYWVIVDPAGKTEGFLHLYRRFKYCRDLIILVSPSTPSGYINYLKERNYDFILTGENRVSLPESFMLLEQRYSIKKILVDSGPALVGVLLNENLADKVSLVVYPVITGRVNGEIFGKVSAGGEFELIKSETLSGGRVWLLYGLKK